MGKSIGFIGNFKGKLGNTVGYKVSQSNSGTNQGVRIYQPNIKNPKSAAQAEQRAKYAPIFATYRALKMIIDRGNEYKPYGNASRIAWLKRAFHAPIMPWYPKETTIEYGIGCQVTFGSLPKIPFEIQGDYMYFDCPTLTPDMDIREVGDLTGALMDNYSFLKMGDQVTFIYQETPLNSLEFKVQSFILDETDTTDINHFSCDRRRLCLQADDTIVSATVIVSRKGANGEHLRSDGTLFIPTDILNYPPYDDASKKAAIASYMANGGANADWAEESIQ